MTELPVSDSRPGPIFLSVSRDFGPGRDRGAGLLSAWVGDLMLDALNY